MLGMQMRQMCHHFKAMVDTVAVRNSGPRCYFLPAGESWEFIYDYSLTLRLSN